MVCYTKTATETLWFSNEKPGEIWYRTMRHPGQAERLVSDIVGDFDLCVDQKEQLHLLCQNLRGDLQQFSKFPGRWERRILLQNRKGKANAQQLRIFDTGETKIVFYRLSHQQKKLLVAHPLSGEPTVLEALSDHPYLLRQDGLGCIHLFFYPLAQPDQLCYRIYRYHSWSSPVPITREYLVADAWAAEPDCIHLALFQGNRLFYAQYREGALQNLCPVAPTAQEAAFVLSEDTLWMQYLCNYQPWYWKEGGVPCRILASGAPQRFALRLAFGQNRGEQCYGIQNNKIPKLFLLGDLPLRSKPVSDTTRIELTKLSLRLDAQNQTIQALQQEITRLKAQKHAHMLSGKDENVEPSS